MIEKVYLLSRNQYILKKKLSTLSIEWMLILSSIMWTMKQQLKTNQSCLLVNLLVYEPQCYIIVKCVLIDSNTLIKSCWQIFH